MRSKCWSCVSSPARRRARLVGPKTAPTPTAGHDPEPTGLGGPAIGFDLAGSNLPAGSEGAAAAAGRVAARLVPRRREAGPELIFHEADVTQVKYGFYCIPLGAPALGMAQSLYRQMQRYWIEHVF